MSESVVESGVPAQGGPSETGTPPGAEGSADPADAGRDWKAEARKWEARAKQNTAAVKESEKARLAAMTDAERAVAEAEARGRTAAVTAFGQRLATSEIRAAAASVGADLDGVFDYLDLSRFVGDDGEPDMKAVKAFVGGLPVKSSTPPGFDGGPRTTAATPQGMSQIIRKAAGRA